MDECRGVMCLGCSEALAVSILACNTSSNTRDALSVEYTFAEALSYLFNASCKLLHRNLVQGGVQHALDLRAAVTKALEAQGKAARLF
jgi:hypothetical protein